MQMQIKSLAIIVLIAFFFSCSSESTPTYKIYTEYGDIYIQLYEETHKYKENFTELADKGFYDSLLFHRILPGMIIQGGDPTSRNAPKGKFLGQGDVDYTIPGDFRYVHTRGAISAARKPNSVNPDKKSSGSQFFIVLGNDVNDGMLDKIEKDRNFEYSVEQRKLYKLIGGIPQFDKEYSVFGEVISGLDVVEKISQLRRDPNDRPVEDVIMKIEVANEGNIQ
ncbi:peptidylprolyl isomerase [Membranihabitans maritimus]|uniref:peptidylprolyl isomerase n=1 Tax=Membranihabitans maritimus TaxID=2904244 RepID=UPI001F261829|nr:peptidylprolyl isomerase [Membranihabitans maritimus]